MNAAAGAIGLGYLKTKAGVCDQGSICDFESGSCNWTSTSTNPNYKLKLTQATGDAWGESDGSEYDHTTDSSYGHFMEASGGLKIP